MSVARHHAEWLSLLEVSGPFLSLPVLLRAFPQGLEAHDPDLAGDLRLAYDEWLDNQGGARPDPAIHRAWVEWVLSRVLDMPAAYVLPGTSDAGKAVAVTVAEHGETLRPDLLVAKPATATADSVNDTSARAAARLLIQILPPGQDPERPLPGHRWKASPATRMMELLHATGVRLGLVTNGERWMLVDAPKDDTTGFISWYAGLWLEEPLTLRAFRSLLKAQRFFGVSQNETIEALLKDSASDQQQVTEQLGYQVRTAVEVLVQALDLADQDRGRTLLTGLSEELIYEAALTVMMRLVFLFSAEERDMLLLSDPVYDDSYAVSTLRAQLRESADQTGEEILELRCDAWARLLAAFRAVYAGIRHDRLTLPAYGGSLFDPDRFPFLEGRTARTDWRKTPAQPLPINNRTVLHLLDALQMLQVQVPGAGPAEARRLSFRALDIEQIGHVYEGLLDHTAVRATAPVLGLAGARNQEPEIPLATLEQWRAKGQEELVGFLLEQTGRSAGALRKALQAEPDLLISPELRAACGNDEALYSRVLPFAGLIRLDSYGRPMVIPAASLYVTGGKERRATGTHYTPRILTEPIVQHTLEPQVYRGPAAGWPRDKWQLRPAAELLSLKVCDMAMGSGAFLVQTCRYLSERLVEAWEIAEGALRLAKNAKGQWITAQGTATANPDAAIPADTTERLTLARRLVADRCLYGVDKNPLAVEMAKLSLWLITLDKGRPFTFLDHAFKCGDSLVGVSLDQLLCWSLVDTGEREFATEGIRLDIDKVVDLRRRIESLPVLEPRDQEHKAHLLAQAEALTHDLRRGADMLVGSYLNDLPAKPRAALRAALLHAFRDGASLSPEQARAADLGALRPFHWPLEFPEVFLARGRDGFDAFVGNPPFMAGRGITSALGQVYAGYLQCAYAGTSGGADLCAFFFLRAHDRLRARGTLGLLATKSISEGDTRHAALEQIASRDGCVYRAVGSAPWPGSAAVFVSVLHIVKGEWLGERMLGEVAVGFISPSLDSEKTVTLPSRLRRNAGKSFQGSIVLGRGFVLTLETATALIARRPQNADVIRLFLNGEDLNTNPDPLPSRAVIDFGERTEEEARAYAECYQIVRRAVYPERASKDAAKYPRMVNEWWKWWNARYELYATVRSLPRVLVTALTTKYLCFTWGDPTWSFSHACGVLAFHDGARLSVVQSSLHEVWARKHGSTLGTTLRYTPSDVFETFPLPPSHVGALDALGDTYHEHRRQIMVARQEGLTATYNRFHNPQEQATDIARLRELHVEMDQAVAAAYGWGDLDLEHGFHQTAQGLRFTISEAARREVLDRLLALNHERYAEEVRAGLHEKKKAGKGKRKAGSRDTENGQLEML